jgi:hypothetical protein
MTYQQKFQELKTQFSIASQKYITLERELSSAHSTDDISFSQEYLNSKNEWLGICNSYHGFICYCIQKGVIPEDEIMN